MITIIGHRYRRRLPGEGGCRSCRKPAASASFPAIWRLKGISTKQRPLVGAIGELQHSSSADVCCSTVAVPQP